MLQSSIKVSLIVVSVEQLTYIDGLKIFKFYDHPEISVEIEVMKIRKKNMVTTISLIRDTRHNHIFTCILDLYYVHIHDTIFTS